MEYRASAEDIAQCHPPNLCEAVKEAAICYQKVDHFTFNMSKKTGVLIVNLGTQIVLQLLMLKGTCLNF